MVPSTEVYFLFFILYFLLFLFIPLFTCAVYFIKISWRTAKLPWFSRALAELQWLQTLCFHSGSFLFQAVFLTTNSVIESGRLWSHGSNCKYAAVNISKIWWGGYPFPTRRPPRLVWITLKWIPREKPNGGFLWSFPVSSNLLLGEHKRKAFRQGIRHSCWPLMKHKSRPQFVVTQQDFCSL